MSNNEEIIELINSGAWSDILAGVAQIKNGESSAVELLTSFSPVFADISMRPVNLSIRIHCLLYTSDAADE